MERKTRAHLEQVLNILRTPQQTATISEENDEQDKVTPAGAAPTAAVVISPPPAPKAKMTIQAIRSTRRFSLWPWLFKGIRDDKIGAVLAFSLLLCGVPLSCASVGYALFAVI